MPEFHQPRLPLLSAIDRIRRDLAHLEMLVRKVVPEDPPEAPTARRVSREEWEAIERTLNERGMTDPRDLWVAKEVRELLGIEIEGEEGDHDDD